jgi:hypothetical protein
MEKIIVERTVAGWDELSAEQQKKEIEKLFHEEYGLQAFFDDAWVWYDEALKEIEAETLQEDPVKYKAVRFNRDKMHWQSGSQGWHYDHCGPADFLTHKDVYKKTKRYCLELQDCYEYWPVTQGGYAHVFEWYLSITTGGITHEYTGELSDIQKEFEQQGFDIPMAVIRTVKKYEKQFLEEFKELKKRVEDEIKAYDQYWPSDEEIAEFFRVNETEFVIEEGEVERIEL